MLNSPAAVTDLQGNIHHLFAGEWADSTMNGPAKTGPICITLSRLPVPPPGGGNSFRQCPKHTDQGASAPTAIFLGPEGQPRSEIVGRDGASGAPCFEMSIPLTL